MKSTLALFLALSLAACASVPGRSCYTTDAQYHDDSFKACPVVAATTGSACSCGVAPGRVEVH